MGKFIRKTERISFFKFFNLILFILTAATIIPQESNTPKRTLYLFTLSKNEPRLLAQLKFLSSDLEGQTERDMEILNPIILMDQKREKIGVEIPENPYPFRLPIINIRNPFCLILIGKDGHEKLRSYEPVSLKKIFQLIDQMPMRQEEMKAQD